MRHRFDLVIFDCDGVLVDSECLASSLLADFINELGGCLTGQDCRARFTGLSIKAVGEMLRADGLDIPEDFEPRLRARDRLHFERELKPIPGIHGALDTLSGPRCVASSGSPEKIRHSLTLCHLLDRFDPYLFSAVQVDRGKPAPDLFLHAAGAMGVSPDRSVVIEDSRAGVAAGRAAGMTVAGFVGGGHCDVGHDTALWEAGADQVFGDMADLPSLLAAL
ncbi:MAG: HAD family hydrolase [Magnetovibrionaceae bacterium]